MYVLSQIRPRLSTIILIFLTSAKGRKNGTVIIHHRPYTCQQKNEQFIP